jgi:hypothetical protein
MHVLRIFAGILLYLLIPSRAPCLARTSIEYAACPSYRGLRPQPKKQKEIAARNFLQKSGEVIDIDSIRSRGSAKISAGARIASGSMEERP